MARLQRNPEDEPRLLGQGREGRQPAGATPGPKAPGMQARALSRTLPQLSAEGLAVHTALGPLPGRRWFASRRSSGRARSGRSELTPAQPRSSRASEACSAGRVKARPACQAATAAQPSAPDAVRPQRHGRGAASPALALAAEQHGERRLALGWRDARRRSLRIGQAAVRVGSKQNPPPGSPPGPEAEVGGGLAGACSGPLTSKAALSARGSPGTLPAAGPLPPRGRPGSLNPECLSSPFPLHHLSPSPHLHPPPRFSQLWTVVLFSIPSLLRRPELGSEHRKGRWVTVTLRPHVDHRGGGHASIPGKV